MRRLARRPIVKLKPRKARITGRSTALLAVFTVSFRRRAFGGGARHASFGPFGADTPGFTRRYRSQGQFQLDILPPGSHERVVLLTLFIVQAFTGKPATMPSADFCAAITGLTSPLSPGLPDTTQTSRGKIDRLHCTPAGFTTPALDGCGLRDLWLARPTGQASYPVLVHRVTALIRSSFRLRLAATPLPFANPSPPSGWIEDSHLQADDHARHTKKRRPHCLRAPQSHSPLLHHGLVSESPQ